ncbi:MAG: N(G),N(G)-dimethylarginine dimethylaminohydrolase [Streptosporangiales bacterium]|nr:N(G),N(G)-dimethylarginine dimethylaminohydrolase [Streptosporangiales bacterium]
MTPNSPGTALVRPVPDTLAEGIVTHIERQPVDVDAARLQHEAYAAALFAAGWRVEQVTPVPDCPDSVFVEDALVVVGDVAVVTRPGAAVRRDELAGAREAAVRAGLTLRAIEEPGTLDGGDVLQVGDTVYVGRGGRTDGDGIRQLRVIVAPLGRRVVPVPLGAVLHLKSAVTALPDGTCVGLRDLVDARLFPSWRDVEEESGCHVVPLGGSRLLMAASAPRTAEHYADLGFDVVAVDIGEFEKLEGCVTCLSVLLPGR